MRVPLFLSPIHPSSTLMKSTQNHLPSDFHTCLAAHEDRQLIFERKATVTHDARSRIGKGIATNLI